MKKRRALRCTETSGKQKVWEGGKEEERKTPDVKASGDVFKMHTSAEECSYRERVPHISFPLSFAGFHSCCFRCYSLFGWVAGWMDGWCRERRLSFSVVLIDLLLLQQPLWGKKCACFVLTNSAPGGEQIAVPRTT